MDPIDTVFAKRLRAQIKTQLFGDEQTQGLYQHAVNARSWDQHQRIVGRIDGLREAAAMIDNVLQQLADPKQDKPHHAVNGLN